MYVRTKKGIAKIIDRILDPDHYYFKMWVTDRFLEINYDIEYISEVDVLKASHNIIDLIEEGDYVNGRKVVDIFYDANDDVMNICVLGSIVYDNNEIKSIVTHEQMEQIDYKVGE